jgi:hypothetical protein
MSEPERVDLRKLVDRFSPEEMVIAAGSLVLLVSLFLNWISVSCNGAYCGGAGGGASGFRGWGWLSFLAVIGVAGLLVARRLVAEKVELPALPASDSVLYMAGGALEILGCLLFWIEYHNDFVSSGAGIVSISSGLGFGWFVALLAGVATVVGGYLTTRHPQHASRGFSPPHAPAPPVA